MEELKKLRCKKQFGVWYYRVIFPTWHNLLDAPIYELYNSEKKHVADFAYYGDMKIYIQTGTII